MHHLIYPTKDTYITNQSAYTDENFGLDEILRVGSYSQYSNVRVYTDTYTYSTNQYFSCLLVDNFAGTITGSFSGSALITSGSIIGTGIFSSSYFIGTVTGSIYGTENGIAVNSSSYSGSLTSFSGSISSSIGGISGYVTSSLIASYFITYTGYISGSAGAITGYLSGSNIANEQGYQVVENKIINRALLKFNIDSISSSISNGEIVSPKFKLKLKIAKEEELPLSYKIYAFPISQSWQNGNGYLSDGGSTDGASWNWRDLYSGSIWYAVTESNFLPTEDYLNNSASAVKSFERGGGTWYYKDSYSSSVICTQSFDYETSDLSMDVSPIVMAWISGSLPNEGFIVINSLENATGSNGMLTFFSKDTNTIYSPVLDVMWDDSTWVTGSTSTGSVVITSISSGANTTIYSGSSFSIDGGISGVFSASTFLQKSTHFVTASDQSVSGEYQLVTGSIYGSVDGYVVNISGSVSGSVKFTSSYFSGSVDGEKYIFIPNVYSPYYSGSVLLGFVSNAGFITTDLTGSYMTASLIGLYTLSGSIYGTINTGYSNFTGSWIDSDIAGLTLSGSVSGTYHTTSQISTTTSWSSSFSGSVGSGFVIGGGIITTDMTGSYVTASMIGNYTLNGNVYGTIDTGSDNFTGSWADSELSGLSLSGSLSGTYHITNETSSTTYWSSSFSGSVISGFVTGGGIVTTDMTESYVTASMVGSYTLDGSVYGTIDTGSDNFTSSWVDSELSGLSISGSILGTYFTSSTSGSTIYFSQSFSGSVDSGFVIGGGIITTDMTGSYVTASMVGFYGLNGNVYGTIDTGSNNFTGSWVDSELSGLSISGSILGTYFTTLLTSINYNYSESILSGSLIDNINTYPQTSKDIWSSGSYGSLYYGLGPVFGVNSGSVFSITTASLLMASSSFSLNSGSMMRLLVYYCDTLTEFSAPIYYHTPQIGSTPLYEINGATTELILSGTFGGDGAGFNINMSKVTFVPTASLLLPYTGYYTLILEPDYTLLGDAASLNILGPNWSEYTPMTSSTGFDNNVTIEPYMLWKFVNKNTGNAIFQTTVEGSNTTPMFLSLSGSGKISQSLFNAQSGSLIEMRQESINAQSTQNEASSSAFVYFACGVSFHVDSGSLYSISTASVLLSSASVDVGVNFTDYLSLYEAYLYQCERNYATYGYVPIPGFKADPIYKFPYVTMSYLSGTPYTTSLVPLKVSFASTCSYVLPMSGSYPKDYAIFFVPPASGSLGYVPDFHTRYLITDNLPTGSRIDGISDFSSSVYILNALLVYRTPDGSTGVGQAIGETGDNTKSIFVHIEGSALLSASLSTTSSVTSSFEGFITTGTASGSAFSASITSSTNMSASISGSVLSVSGSLYGTLASGSYTGSWLDSYLSGITTSGSVSGVYTTGSISTPATETTSSFYGFITTGTASGSVFSASITSSTNMSASVSGSTLSISGSLYGTLASGSYTGSWLDSYLLGITTSGSISGIYTTSSYTTIISSSYTSSFDGYVTTGVASGSVFSASITSITNMSASVSGSTLTISGSLYGTLASGSYTGSWLDSYLSGITTSGSVSGVYTTSSYTTIISSSYTSSFDGYVTVGTASGSVFSASIDMNSNMTSSVYGSVLNVSGSLFGTLVDDVYTGKWTNSYLSGITTSGSVLGTYYYPTGSSISSSFINGIVSGSFQSTGSVSVFSGSVISSLLNMNGMFTGYYLDTVSFYVSGIVIGMGSSGNIIGIPVNGTAVGTMNMTPVTITGSCGSSFVASIITASFINGVFSGSTFTAYYVNYKLQNAILTGSWTQDALLGATVSIPIPSGIDPYAYANVSGIYVNGTALGTYTTSGSISGSAGSASASFSGQFINGTLIGGTLNLQLSGSIYTSSYQYTSSVSYTTSSLTALNVSVPFTAVVQNLKPSYTAGNVMRVNVFGREEHPLKNFTRKTQLTQYLTPNYLPTSSYYSIKDNETEEVIIDFDDYTKLSCDTSGNYFKLDTTAFAQERNYRIRLKVKNSELVYVFDSGDVFKIVR